MSKLEFFCLKYATYKLFKFFLDNNELLALYDKQL